MNRMNYVSVISNNIDSVAYDIETSTLGIRFTNNTEYHYYNVPEHIHNGLLSSDSVGKYFDENVKNGGYRYDRIR